ncbi:MAG: response regulator [Sporolactobacillus sp.]
MTNEQENAHSVCLKDRVLVVDDQYGIRILIKEILKKDGIETLLAANGTQALKLLVEEKPSLVLLDMRIPGMSGVEILKKIKEISPETAVMIMTAYGDDEMLAESRENGAAAYFPKPFDIGELLHTVRQALDEQAKKSSGKL